MIRYLLPLLPIFLLSCSPKSSFMADVTPFEGEWISLTLIKGERVIYNSCDGGNLLLTLSREEQGYTLLLHGEQEDTPMTVVGSSQQTDTLIMTCATRGWSGNQKVKVVWQDRKQGLAHWVIQQANRNIRSGGFVSAPHKKAFKEIDQPCRECWGDDCDD